MKKYPKEVDAFGLIIQRLRKEKGYSAQKLADMCSIERRTLTRIEAGEMAATIHNVFALADALGTKPSELFREVEQSS